MQSAVINYDKYTGRPVVYLLFMMMMMIECEGDTDCCAEIFCHVNVWTTTSQILMTLNYA